MKFSIESVSSFAHKILSYSAEDGAFNMEPVIQGVDYSIVVNHINMSVVDGHVAQIWGYCPHQGWIKADYQTPKSQKGSLNVEADVEPGFSYGVGSEEDWPVHVNLKSGWVCLGDPEAQGTAVEFLDDCLAVVNDSQLVSLWLRPRKLPSL